MNNHNFWDNFFQSLWDNFVLPIAVAIIIGLFVLIRKKRKNNIKGNVNEASQIRPVSFINLCQRILPLLIENNYVFRTFGPNSSANESEPLRTDMELWKQSKIEIIVPNNDKVEELISENLELIPEVHKDIFKKLQSHIFAFKKHVENEKFDYSSFQFPQEIDKIVKDICFEGSKNESYFNKIIDGILAEYKMAEVDKIVLFGSFLFYSTNKNDIDLAILLDTSGTADVKKMKKKFDKANNRIFKKYKKNVHLSVFTSEELENFEKFISINNYKMILYG